ncbi:hypothetical protein [Bacillus massilinigeriensis]|nr:hypothetical protein [Bacillus mediterraneensis]
MALKPAQSTGFYDIMVTPLKFGFNIVKGIVVIYGGFNWNEAVEPLVFP